MNFKLTAEQVKASIGYWSRDNHICYDKCPPLNGLNHSTNSFINQVIEKYNISLEESTESKDDSTESKDSIENQTNSSPNHIDKDEDGFIQPQKIKKTSTSKIKSMSNGKSSSSRMKTLQL